MEEYKEYMWYYREVEQEKHRQVDLMVTRHAQHCRVEKSI